MPTGIPHLPQNLMDAGYSCLQREQATVPGDDAEETDGALPALFTLAASSVTKINLVLPQRPQNLIPSANREPQLAHATTRGALGTPVLLSRLPPCDGVKGWLEGALLNCAWIICSMPSGRISITRSSSTSPLRATRSTCCPGGMELRITRP